MDPGKDYTGPDPTTKKKIYQLQKNPDPSLLKFRVWIRSKARIRNPGYRTCDSSHELLVVVVVEVLDERHQGLQPSVALHYNQILLCIDLFLISPLSGSFILI